MFINLVGAVGEFASKAAKLIRKEKFKIGGDNSVLKNNFYFDKNFNAATDTECVEEMQKELGDILWQLAGLCKVMGWELEEIAQINLDKLAARKVAGTIDGCGDGIARPK